MEEIVIKVDIPAEFKERFELALTESIKSFVRELEFSMVESTLSKSKLTEEQALKLGDELKEQVWERHKKQGW